MEDDHFDFHKVPVYRTAFQLVLDVLDFLKPLPRERRIDVANKCGCAMAIVPAKIVGSRAFSSGVERADYLNISLHNLDEAARFMQQIADEKLASPEETAPFLERMAALKVELLRYQKQSLAFNNSVWDDETVEWMNELDKEDFDPLDSFSNN